LGNNTDLLPLAEVMGAGGKQLEAEGLKADDWQFHKRVEYPCAPPLAACSICSFCRRARRVLTRATCTLTQQHALQLEVHGG
jgi:hypothetical protein